MSAGNENQALFRCRVVIRERLRDLQSRLRRLKRETVAMLLALRDPRTPWYARLLLLLVVGYALSPIDLVPDFIPVLGYLDDLLIVPLGIALAIRLIPEEVLADCRARSEHQAEARLQARRRYGWIVALLVVVVWILLALLTSWWLWSLITTSGLLES